MPDYGNASYWDERYSADEKSYDWYQDYSTLGKYIAPYLKRVTDFEILIAGCGTSRLGAEIYDSGYVNVTNIDISTVAINQMSANCADREEMEFTVLDARNMEFIPNQCFDLIIDKALFDSILCSPNNLTDMEALLKEMYRVLKLGGVYIIISHGGPDSRVGHIKRHIDVEIQAISIPKPVVKDVVEEGEAKYHFMYVCTKTIPI